MKTKQQKIEYILEKVKDIDDKELALMNIVVDVNFMKVHDDPFLWSHKLLDKIINRIDLYNPKIRCTLAL